jgi:hypothetical protein
LTPFDQLAQFAVQHEACRTTATPPTDGDVIAAGDAVTMRCSGCGATITVEIDQALGTEHVLSTARLAGFKRTGDEFFALANNEQTRMLDSPQARDAITHDVERARRAERKH